MNLKHRWPYYSFVLIAWVGYIVLSLLAPAPKNTQVHLNSVLIALLAVTLIIPYLLTWLIGVLGVYHFRRFIHAARRKHLPNTAAFETISYGIAFLVLDLIAIPFFSVARNVWINNSHDVTGITIASNYTHTALSLLAFGLLFRGSRVLTRSSSYAAGIRSRALPAIIANLLFGVLFTLAVFNNPSRQVASQSGMFASYYLSDPVIFITIVIPVVAAWFLGLQAALNTERYAHALSNPGWKKATLRYFYGLLSIVSSAIILQGLTVIGNQQAQQFNLGLLIVTIYLFIILQATGYLFISSSAKQLRKAIDDEAKT